jgi:hypothetical protein
LPSRQQLTWDVGCVEVAAYLHNLQQQQQQKKKKSCGLLLHLQAFDDGTLPCWQQLPWDVGRVKVAGDLDNLQQQQQQQQPQQQQIACGFLLHLQALQMCC